MSEKKRSPSKENDDRDLMLRVISKWMLLSLIILSVYPYQYLSIFLATRRDPSKRRIKPTDPSVMAMLEQLADDDDSDEEFIPGGLGNVSFLFTFVIIFCNFMIMYIN